MGYYCSCGAELQSTWEVERGECEECAMSGDGTLWANFNWNYCEGCKEYLHIPDKNPHEEVTECKLNRAPFCLQKEDKVL